MWAFRSYVMHSGLRSERSWSRSEKEMFPPMYGCLIDAVYISHSFYLYESHFGCHLTHVLPFIFLLWSDQACLCNSLSLWCPVSPSNPCCYDSSPAPCWSSSAPRAGTGWLNLTCSLRLGCKTLTPQSSLLEYWCADINYCLKTMKFEWL